METTSIEVCSVCQDCMTEPRLLPCNHSFCLKCLDLSLVNEKLPVCPKCHIEYEVPKGGLEYLKKNEFIEKLTQLDYVDCNFCSSEPAVKYCYDCTYYICSPCLLLHQKFPANADHNLHELKSKFGNRTRSKNYQSCRTHLEVLNLYCDNCKLPLCSRCMISSHSGHEMVHISNYYDTVLSSLNESIELNEGCLKNISVSHKNSLEKVSSNELKAFKLKKEVEERGKLMKKLTDLIVQNYSESIDKELLSHKNEASNIMERLQSMETNSTQKIEHLKLLRDNLSYENIMDSAGQVSFVTVNIPSFSRDLKIVLNLGEGSMAQSLKTIIGNLSGVEDNTNEDWSCLDLVCDAEAKHEDKDEAEEEYYDPVEDDSSTL